MFFWICIICGWVILSFPLGVLIGKIIRFNTGNCRQESGCNCGTNKDDKIN